MNFTGDFSIELTAERIVDVRTKDYFREVYNSYANGNFRSSIVMLWSVVVCDILFKLEELRSMYEDKIAENILKEIEEQQKRNPKSPEWESSLLEKVRDRTSLLDIAEFGNLAFLQQHRHVSAHPVLTAGYALFSPSREIARAHIRSALEAVLTKPPIMTKKIFDTFVKDIAHAQHVLPDNTSLRRYLEAKYFPRISGPVEDSIFRSLWRLVFKTTDLECDKNRNINFRTLRILFHRRTQDLTARIQGERDYYSNIATSGEPIEKMAEFLCEYPQIYMLLTDAARLPIQALASKSDNQLALAWFLADRFQSHLSFVLEKAKNGKLNITPETHSKLFAIAKNEGHQDVVVEIGVHLYVNSEDFNDADERFSGMIEPYLNTLTENHLVICLQGIESNNQTYRRSRAKYEHKQLKTQCERVWGLSFDPAQYPRFAENVK
jgi:hypothetical protein